MSGSDTICVVTRLLEPGRIAATEPVTRLTLRLARNRESRCKSQSGFHSAGPFADCVSVQLDSGDGAGAGRQCAGGKYGGPGYLTMCPATLDAAPSNYPTPATFGYNRHDILELSPADGQFKKLPNFTTALILDASGHFVP